MRHFHIYIGVLYNVKCSPINLSWKGYFFVLRLDPNRDRVDLGLRICVLVTELLHRVILLSGSGLSPWALQRDPLWVKRKVAEDTGCHGDLHEDDLAPCLRLKPLNFLLNIKVDTPRFLPGKLTLLGFVLLKPFQHEISFH